MDMADVVFISRSVADELCSLAEIYTIDFINTIPFVRNMIEIVKQGRRSHRVRTKQKSQIIECNDMNSLSALFSSM